LVSTAKEIDNNLPLAPNLTSEKVISISKSSF